MLVPRTQRLNFWKQNPRSYVEHWYQKRWIRPGCLPKHRETSKQKTPHHSRVNQLKCTKTPMCQLDARLTPFLEQFLHGGEIVQVFFAVHFGPPRTSVTDEEWAEQSLGIQFGGRSNHHGLLWHSTCDMLFWHALITSKPSIPCGEC
jgi:hypothetical protein